MKALLLKIRRLLKDKRFRRIWTRLVSTTAAVVVFITTYALVLPAITLESGAYCGIEAHQHDDECYEEVLVCGLPEDPGHYHDESCYAYRQELVCTLEEHIHSESCLDEEGNVVCGIEEHTHSENCFEDVQELICTLEESDGHQHDASCYEKVLVCDKEVHIHSAECYQNPEETVETAAVATTQAASVGTESDLSWDDGGGDAYDDPYESEDPESEDPESEDPGTWDDAGSAGSGEWAESEESSGDLTDPDNEDGYTEEPDDAAAAADVPEEEDAYVPALDPLHMASVLSGRTAIYYYHPEEGELIEDSSLITDWKKVDSRTELDPDDLIRVYLAYTIPAGSLNETNQTAVLPLPENLHLSDAQISAINSLENGLAAGYVDYSTLTITDLDNYHKYLGLEAVEGTRTPDQEINEYLNELAAKGKEAQEYISAVVRVEDIYDTEGHYGEKGASLGEGLVFTFAPYTIEKNQHTYDAGGSPTKAGEKVQGWLTLDFNLGQVDLGEPVIDEGRGIRTAEVVFADEDRSLGIDEISTKLNVVTEVEAEEHPEAEEGSDVPAEEDPEEEPDALTAEEDPGEETTETAEEENAQELAEEDMETSAAADTASADEKEEEKEKEPEKKPIMLFPEDEEKTAEPVMPAMSFTETIQVPTGKPVNTEEGGVGYAVDTAADALPDEAGVSVRVEADEGTLPAGTTMVLSAVGDMDAVAETVREAVEKDASGNGENTDASAGGENSNPKAYGFQAVNISFLDADGNEIAPAKPVRVALTSEIVEQVRQEIQDNENTPVIDPVVVHMDEAGHAEQMELVDPEEIEPARGRSEEELLEEQEAIRKEQEEQSAVSENEEQSAASGSEEQAAEQETDLQETTAQPAEQEMPALEKEGQTEPGPEVNVENVEMEENTEASGDDGDLPEAQGEEADETASPVTEEAEPSDPSGDDAEAAGDAEDADTAGTVESGEDAQESSGDSAEAQEPSADGAAAGSGESASSVYVIVYTVDFHWEVNGNKYEFNIPGGGFVSFTDLVEVLGIAKKDVQEEPAGNAPEASDEQGGNTVLTLDDVEPGEATRQFVMDVETIEFSTPELLHVSRVEEETTAGAVKEQFGLDCEYSAELTEEQIERINAQSVEAGDWALISMRPFKTEEFLTVTMKDGESFTIRVTDAQIRKTVISASGETYEITVTYDDFAQIPDDAELQVREILPEDADYQAYYRKSLEKVGAAAGQAENSAAEAPDEDQARDSAALLPDAAESGDSAPGEKGGTIPQGERRKVEYARFFDIEIHAGGRKIEPERDVTVSIRLLDAPEGTEAVPAVVHFAEAGPEVLEISGGKKGGEDAIQFETGEFSVYSVMYTVDFHWEVNGRTYAISIPGGSYASVEYLVEKLGMAETDSPAAANVAEATAPKPPVVISMADPEDIEISEAARALVAEIASIEFSAPELMWTGRIDEDITILDLRVRNDLDAVYSAALTPEQIDTINQSVVKQGDWVLLSLKPFTTVESLTVTMKNGDAFTVTVTDAQNAPMNPDGQTVQTIPAPSGTTIDMFDYWLDSETEVARRGWPGYRRNGTTGYDNYFWSNFSTPTNFDTNGNVTGINNDHKLKFLPSMGGMVRDWDTAGTYYDTSLDGRVAGINSWNGYNQNNTNYYNGAPTTGIIADALYNQNGVLDENGYPRLNSALGGESLDYLFNPSTTHSGKRSYGNAGSFLYVDPDGYYTYDSMDYSASMNKTSKAFTLRKQPTNDTREGIRGFWPMGDLNYWLGMHLKSEFSMPADGEVLNPKGVYKPMQFEFAGDDDAWAYVDGILVADGGGIHNRTELDINFKTGVVTVIGGTYTNINNPDMTVLSTRTLYDIFLEAKNNGLISNDKWASYRWVDVDGDGTPDTFAQGTELTFDFFYLERGGGESNMYIHYNLISTTDFSAHKSYHALQNDPDARLERDQFKFELIGFDHTGGDPAYVGETVHAVMPVPGTAGGAGTFLDPKKVHSDSAPGGAGVPDGLTAHTAMLIGVAEDGNVNFGDVEISSAYAGKSYQYMVREVVPDDAVNADGVRWDAADDELRAEGGFVKNGITYDAKIYYFVGTVVETAPGSGKYKVDKTRYTDSTYQVVDEETKFFSFVNGYVEPVTLRILKTDDTGDIPLDGAAFSLTRAKKNEEDKWVYRTYQSGNETVTSPTRTGETVQGAVSFDNLTEGHYILEETSAPDGYEKGDPCRWLLTLTKEDSADEILLVPTIQGLNSNGEPVGASETLQVDANNLIRYQVLNNPKLIRLSLNKKWLGGPPADQPVTFELKRYRIYDQPVEVQKSTLNVYRVPDGFDISRAVLARTKEFAGNTTARVTWTYDGLMWDGWKDGLYRIGNGANQNAASSGGTFWLNVSMPASGEVNLYIRDGNMYGGYSQYQVRVNEPTGTAPSSQAPDPIHQIEVDPTFTGHTHTFPAGTTDWTFDGFGAFPAVGTNPDYDVPESYTYFIEEVPVAAGYDVVYDRMDGTRIAGSADSEERVITNQKRTDVPVNKTWEWSEDDQNRAHHWDATFVLEYRETLVSGDPADDAKHTWEEVAGVGRKTIHNGDTGDAVTFRDLPMYREHSNGSVYRIIYAVDEVAYHVYDSSNNVIARWTKDGSESQIGIRYAPDYEQDAGEGDQPDEYADWPEWYTITLTNVIHETTEVNTINLAVEKIWEEGTELSDGSFARFRLRRYVHQEYRDYSKEGIDTSQWVTVTLDLGSRQTQIQVPKGAPVHVSGMVKAGRSAGLTFELPDHSTSTMELDNSGSSIQAIADTPAFNPQSDCTILFTGGNTDPIIGGLEGIRLACYYDKQDPDIDEAFNVDTGTHIDPAGQIFTLSNANHWQKDWIELPQVVEGRLNGDLQTVYVYSYFLEELETDPENFVAIFKNSAGEELGDSHIPVDFSTTIIAENEESTKVTVQKVWDDQDSEDRPESLTVTLLADGVMTDHTVTLDESNHWKDSIEDLPKYNGGVEIDYQWLEGTMPAGYFLTHVDRTESDTDGAVTTLTNSLSKYDIRTSYVGTKDWSDSHNQFLTRPHELVVSLYADGYLTDHTPVWTEGPGENQWTYTFRDLPVFTEDGEIIEYTAVEDPVPGGYAESHTVTETDGQIGTVATITYNNGADRITQNGRIVWELESEIDLAFFAINTSGNRDIPVWTHRTPLPDEVTELQNLIQAHALSGNPNRHIVIFSGTGTVRIPNSNDSVTVTYDEDDRTVTLDFGSTSVWNDFIVGQFNSPYEPGSTTFTNTLQTTSLSGSKTWTIPAGIEHPDPILKLTRTTTSIDIDGTPVVSAPETVQVKVGNDMVNLQPEWSGDGATMRSFTYSGLPRYDQTGKEYTYSVEEVSFTIGSGADAVVYTAVKDSNGIYTVTADKPDAEMFMTTQNGNNIVNGPLKADLEIIKVEKGHKDSEHTLSGAKFQLTRVNENNNNNWQGEGAYTSEIRTVDPQTGRVVFEGLRPGRYKLEEKEAPAGYVLLESSWFFTVSSTGTMTFEAGYTLVSPADGENVFYIENVPGAELPASGGPGTIMFYLAGLVLTAFAGAVLLTGRKKKPV